MSYAPGDALNFAGGAIEVTYASGAKNTVAMTASGVSFSAETAQSENGTQKITVTYAGKTATFDVTVTAQEEVEKSGGCNASMFGGAILAGTVLVMAAVCFVCLKRKTSDK